jgi:hypothetical protein
MVSVLAKKDGILRYPLSKTSRSMFKDGAEFVPVALEDNHLIMNEYEFKLTDNLPIPDRYNVFPGARIDENGVPKLHSFKKEVCEHLEEPPLLSKT